MADVKLAVISDIHGNLPALEAVLDDIAHRGVDLTVDLGDCVSGPLWPAETADRLMALDLPTIRGNHERQLLTLKPEAMGASDAFTAARLRPEHLDWLRALPPSLRLDEVLLVHGTPRRDTEYFLDTVEPDGLRPATPAKATMRAAGVDARLILCGHTHLQRQLTLADGRLVANPGSVGLPAYADDEPWPHVMESRSPHARYLIAERVSKGWTVAVMACAYDWDAAAEQAARNGRPDWALALKTGRM